MTADDVEDRLIAAFTARPGVVPFHNAIEAAALSRVFQEAGLVRVAGRIESIFWAEREGVREAMEVLRRR